MSATTFLRRALCLATGAALATAAATPACAEQASEDWQTIDALTAMVASALGRTATPIDRRIKLARCPEQVSVTAIDANALAVRCATIGWRLRVPLSTPDGAVAVPASLARPAVAAPVIRRGDNVRVTIDTDSYSVSYTAVATQDGRVGETIGLRGSDTKSALSATVTGPGRARLID